jgi:transcriptional regulator with XRE-family HTH domain
MTYLEEIMKPTGLSQYRLAKITPLNQARISLILNRKSLPTEKEIKILEQFFKLPIENLLEKI